MSSRLSTFLLLVMGLFAGFAQGQDVYRAGVGSESLMPGEESFSLALAGYAGPWAGRFTLNWIEKGKATASPHISKENKKKIPAKVSKSPFAKEIKKWLIEGGDFYGLNRNGILRRISLRGKSEQWQTFPVLPSARDFVVYNHFVYAATGTDTLWKMNVNNPDAGWHRAGYYNGQIRKVNLHKLMVHANKLYAVNESDSLFEAGKNYGTPQESLVVRALAIQKEKQTVLMICLDLCGMNYNFTNELKKELGKKWGLSPAAILVNASHTHFVPGTQDWSTWAPHNRLPDSNYLNKVVRPGILKAADKALKNRKPSSIYFGRGTTAIGRNRSNGREETPYDNAVDVIKVVSQDGKENAVLVLSGCHPVGGTQGKRHFTISSNYPGYLRALIEQKAQVPTTALFMQGCGGDINPRDEPEVTGSKLAEDAGRVLTGTMVPLQGDILFNLDTLQVPTSPWSKEKINEFREENVRLGAQMEPERNVAWADLLLKQYDNGTVPANMPIYIHSIRIGNWKLVGLSRETVTEYSLAIKKIWPDQLVSVAGYCNDVSSYLPVERHIRTGVYEGIGSFFWYGQPSFFPLNILDLVVDKIRASRF